MTTLHNEKEKKKFKLVSKKGKNNNAKKNAYR